MRQMQNKQQNCVVTSNRTDHFLSSLIEIRLAHNSGKGVQHADLTDDHHNQLPEQPSSHGDTKMFFPYDENFRIYLLNNFLTIFVITLNVSGVNIPIKRHRLLY